MADAAEIPNQSQKSSPESKPLPSQSRELPAEPPSPRTDPSASTPSTVKELFDLLSGTIESKNLPPVLRYLNEGNKTNELVERGITSEDLRETEGKAGQLLLSYGLDPQELLQLWGEQPNSRMSQGILENSLGWAGENLAQILLLEESQPGICKILRDEFGIRNFARYPREILIQQYLERERTDLPYGVNIGAVADHNVAYVNRSENGRLQDTINQGNHPTHLVRYIEVGGKFELAKRLLQLGKRYNPNNLDEKKIAFAVIEAHGDPYSIQLSQDDNPDSIVTTQDFSGEAGLKLISLFRENPTIILDACLTAKERKHFLGRPFISFARKLSTLGAEVIATNQPSYGTVITTTTDTQGALHFDVQYLVPSLFSRKPKGIRKIPGMRFINGQRVAVK